MERDIIDIIQDKAVTAWSNDPRSFLEMCTGSGKTLVAIRIIEKVINKFPDAKVLIIVPTELIRDKVFPEDFKKFKKSHLLKHCQIECIQTVYKWENMKFTLVVADEVHNYLPKLGDKYEYFKFFENNKYDFFLGLSATIDQELKPFQLKLGKTVFSYNISEAAKDGVVSAFKFINYAIQLTPAELDIYKKTQNSYNYFERELGGPFEAYKNAITYLKSSDKEQSSKAAAFLALVKKRKKILDEASNKILVANQIMNQYPKKNGILFSGDIEQAQKLIKDRSDSVIYHSKMKKKEKVEVIKKLQDGRTKIRWISSVKALNEGVSINNLEIGIELAGNSKAKNLIQRIGRVCRLIEGKRPVVIRLYIPGTQDEKWMRKSQRDLDQSLIYTCSDMNSLIKLIKT